LPYLYYFLLLYLKFKISNNNHLSFIDYQLFWGRLPKAKAFPKLFCHRAIRYNLLLFRTFVIPNETKNLKAKGFPLLSLSKLRRQSNVSQKKDHQKNNDKLSLYRRHKSYQKELYNKI